MAEKVKLGLNEITVKDGATRLSFVISEPLEEAISVEISISDHPNNFSQSLLFLPGETTKNVELPIIPDAPLTSTLIVDKTDLVELEHTELRIDYNSERKVVELYLDEEIFDDFVIIDRITEEITPNTFFETISNATNQSDERVLLADSTATTSTTVTSLSLSDTANSSVAENVAYSASAPTLTGTPIGDVTYSLSGDDASLFSVATDGAVSMVGRDFESPADSGSNNTYSYTLIATDDDGNTASDAVTVTITDAIETVSLSLSDTANSSVAENVAYSASAPTLTGTPIGDVTYSLSGDDASLFSVATDGAVSMVGRDFESPADSGSNNTYSYTLIATDDDGNTASDAVTVTITDASLAMSDTANSSVAENVAYSAAAPTITGAPMGTVTYRLAGADASLFSVATDGAVSMAGQDYENPADTGPDNVYHYTLIAEDEEVNTAFDNVYVTVTDDIEGDTTAPTVSSFSSSTSDGSYNAGDRINITATTSESVQSGNTITVTLDTGDTVVLTAASAGTTLTGTYTVGAGDTSSDLTVSSFSIGTVADTAGNAMTSTTVPSNNNIADNSAIVVDTSAPTISSFSSSTSDGSYNVGDTINITATASESIQSGNTLTVTLDTGDTVVLTAASAGTTLTGTYTVGAGDASSDLTVSSFTIGTVADTAGNAMTSTTVPSNNNIADNSAIVVDTSAPTISSFSSSTSDGSYNVGDTINITATASESIQSGNTLTVTLDTGDTVVLTAASAGTTLTGTYTVGAGDASSDLTVSSFTIGTVADTAGNAMTSTTVPSNNNIADNSAIVVDTSAPTISSFSSSTSDGSYNAGDTINITATASESIQSGNTLTVTLDTGDTVVLTAASAGTTLTGTYTVGAGDASSDLTVSSFTIGTVADTAGNAMTSTTVPSNNNIADNSAIVVDTSAPTLSSSSPADDATAVAVGSNIVLNFSEAVDVESGNIVIYKASDNSVVETIAVGSGQVTGTGTTQITINPSSDLASSTQYYVKIAATGFDDAAGNSYAGITDTTSLSFTTAAPSLSINDVSYTETSSASNATFTVTLSEASGQDVTVDYASSDVSTTAGSDYTASSGTVTISAGATSATFTVPILVDTLDESNETATVTLSNASNASISDATGTLTIVDDDPVPTLSIDNVSHTESSSAGNATFTVTLSEVSGKDVTVDYASSDVSTTAGSDYTAISGTVTILAGNTTASINVPILVDTLDESNETATVTLSNPTNATIASEATQIGSDIDGEAAKDYFGKSVSLSSDGSIVAIGAFGNDGNGTGRGHVSIYQNNSGTWSQIGSDIDGEFDNDGSGVSVSLSGDGSIVAIGARGNDGNGSLSGHVRIYKYESDSWSQIGSDIDGEAANDYSGQSVSLSSDGSTVAIGANRNDGNGTDSGHVRVYQYNSGTSNWSQIGSDIDGEAAGNESGQTVSLSSDGSTVAIGATHNDGNGTDSGHVRVYQYNSGTSNWSQIGSDIDGEAANDYSGQSVSLSNDGSIVAIGAYGNDDNGTNSGHVRVYQYNSGTSNWSQIGSDIDGEAEKDISGQSVSLSSDGSIVAIGAGENDGNGTKSGHVRIYQYNSGTSNWSQIGSDIDGEAEKDYSGGSVSLSSDGSIVAISAWGNINSNGIDSGHVRVFDTGLSADPGTLTIIDDDGDTIAPTLSSSSPADDATAVAVDSNIVLNFSEAVDVESGNIVIYKASDNSVVETIAVGSGQVTGTGTTQITINPSSDLASSTQYYVKIAATGFDDAAGNSYAGITDTTSLSFTTADIVAPTLSSSSPADDATAVAVDSNIVLNFSEAVDVESGNIVIYKASDNSVVETIAVGSGQVTGTGTTQITINPSSDLASSTQYYVKIAATGFDDAAGNSYAGITDTTSLSFTTADIVAPTLSSSSPADDATAVAVDSNIVLNFSEAVDVESGNIVIYKASDNSVVETIAVGSGQVTGTGTTQITINPSSDLASSTQYYVKIAATGFDDAAGNSYAGITDTTSLSFTTADIVAPTLSSSSPADDATAVAVDSNIVLNFSEAVDVESGNIVIYKASDNSVVETIAVGSGQVTGTGTTQITINPSSDLASSTQYYVKIAATGFDDAAGNSYAGITDTTSLSFTTAAPSLSINDVSYTETSSASNATFTVTLSEASGQDVTVDYASSDVSTTAGSDYTASSGTVTISAGATSATFTVPILVDTLDESNETATVTLSNASNASISDATGTLTIVDDDPVPTLSIDNVSHTESSSAGNATFTVTLSEVSGKDVTVDYASSDVSTTAGSDYTASSGTVTIAAGNTTASINVPILVDTLDESNETATVTLSNPTNATIASEATQIGSDIDGEAANDYSGNSVSLSSDGSIVAIGAWLNDVPDSGHVRIYQNNSGTWSQIGDDIDGEANNDHFGVSVSLSGDGSIVAIGADQNGGNGENSGHVRIYQNNSGTWSQVGSDIDGEAENDRSGQSVSLSSDGSTVAIGAYVNDGNGNTNDNRGHVRIYQNNSGTWSQVGSDIDGEASNDSSGQSVSLSSDGSIVAIGAYQNDGNGSQSGHVRIYQNNSGTWSQVGSDIDGEGNYDSSGQSVSLSSDGSIVAIGAYGNDGNGTDSGHVRVYQNNSGNWEQIGSDIDGEAASNYFGYSVSLSSDGSIVAIGAHGNDDNGTNSGHVRIYKYESGTSNWSQIGSDIDGEAASDESGRSVSLSSDGSTVAIGAWLNDGNGTKSGHVRVFDTGLSANTGTLTIVDDDVTPSLSIDDVSFTESGSAGNATFTVTLSEVSGQDVTVDYASSDVSTTAGSDYTASSGTVTIAAGNTTASINVPILVDTLDESNETATVTLSNASNASISDATGTLTIVDDDGDTTASAATLTISLSDFTGATTTSVPSGASGLNAIVEDNLNQAINGTSSADYIEIQDSASSNAGSISGGTGDDIIYIKGWGGATNSSVTGDGGSDTLYINPSIFSSKSNWTNSGGSISGAIHFTNGGSIIINNFEAVNGIWGGAGGQFERNISVTATLNDTDGSESLSDITVSNLPDNTTVKDSNGNAVTVSSNAFTVDNVVSGTAQVFTLTKAGPFDFTASGAITVTESNGGATTTTNSSVLIDGVVEGVEYLTTSGMSGLTNQEGLFNYQDGDDITFKVGGVVLGVATAEDVTSGRTFLQDIADLERSNLSDDYLENMAIFLQSLDANYNPGDGITITQQMRINLADIELDLRQASSGEVKQVIEQVGGIYVERVEAMEHVKDMLIEYSDMSEGDFELIDTERLAAQTESSQSDQQNSLSSIENEKITLDVLADLEDIDSNDELFSELPESSQEYNASEVHDNESTSHDNSSVLPILNSVLNTIENDQVYDI